MDLVEFFRLKLRCWEGTLGKGYVLGRVLRPLNGLG